MGKITGIAQGWAQALFGLAVILVVLFWLLHFIAQHTPAPISTAADWTASHANGAAYSTMGPAL